jgi:hypothetical protein
MLGGISAALLFLSNFLYVVNWIVNGYGQPSWDLWFWIWPITFVFEFLAIVLFVILYKQPVIRYLAVGLFFLARMIYAIVLMSYNNDSVFYLLRTVIGWPFLGSLSVSLFAGLTFFFGTVLFIVSFVLSFIFKSEEEQSIAKPFENFTPPQRVVAPSIKVNAAPGKISDIELLGDLLAKGLLTQEEFDRKKKEILGFN